MRWLPVLVLAYVAIGIQEGVAGVARIHGAGPNLGLIVIVFVALSAPRVPALLACVVIGAMQDLATQQAPGLYALGYGLAGWLIVGMQQVVYRENPLTHAALVLIAGLISGFVVWIHGRITASGASLFPLLGTAIYSAILSPFVIWLLLRMRRMLGMSTHRRGRGAI